MLAIRSSKDITQRVSAEIKSWDNWGVSRDTYVSRRSWNADGVVFNVHDRYVAKASVYEYWTDNGYATLNFKAPTNSEIYAHFEHNWKTSSLGVTASFKLVDLKNTEFTVTYNNKQNAWQTVNNPLVTK